MSGRPDQGRPLLSMRGYCPAIKEEDRHMSRLMAEHWSQLAGRSRPKRLAQYYLATMGGAPAKGVAETMAECHRHAVLQSWQPPLACPISKEACGG